MLIIALIAVAVLATGVYLRWACVPMIIAYGIGRQLVLQRQCRCGNHCPRCRKCVGPVDRMSWYEGGYCECLPDRADVEAARETFAATLPPEQAAEWRALNALTDAERSGLIELEPAGCERTEQAAPAPAMRDFEAPFGRDEDGEPIARYGYRRDGKIRMTRPRARKPQVRASRPVVNREVRPGPRPGELRARGPVGRFVARLIERGRQWIAARIGRREIRLLLQAIERQGRDRQADAG